MSAGTYAAIGAAILAGSIWLGKWWITKSLDARFERRERDEREYRKEQIMDSVRQQQGQQVMTNSLLVILRHMIYGNHITDLEKAQNALKAFDDANTAAMQEKAAKYNLRF